MSRNQIGTFIQQLRKEKGLTQKELGNQINVSDKTISKWENSNSIPDTAILPALCEALDITVNELLSGEKLPPEDFSKKAEENIMNLLKEEQKNKKVEICKLVIGVLFVLVILGGNLAIMQADAMWYIDIWSCAIVLGICAAIILLCGKRRMKDIVKVLRKIVMPVGAFVSLASIIGIAGHQVAAEVILANVAVALLPLLYSIAFYVIFYIVETRIDKTSFL